MERIYKSKENIDPVTMENILQTFTIGALASGIIQGGMVAVTGRTNFRASLIEEQIQNLNEKITQETEKGTITPEKSSIRRTTRSVTWAIRRNTRCKRGS